MTSSTPPKAKKTPLKTTHHGTRILRDDYAWLKQDNWKEMFRDTSLLLPDIRTYLEAENAYTQQNLTHPNDTLINELIAEMRARVQIDYDTAPIQDGPWHYFTRLSAADYPVFLRRAVTMQDNGAGKEQVLLDVNAELATNGRKVFLGDLSFSSDHRWLAVAVDYSGSEDHEILVKDLTTGTFTADRLEHADNIVWHPRGDSFYYAKMTDSEGEFRRDRVFRHRLGETQAQDALVFADADTGFYLGIDRTSDRRFLMISVRNATTSETHILDMRAADEKLLCLAPRGDQILYDIDHAHGTFFIRTNEDGATEFKLMCAPASAPQRANWREIEPHRPGRLIRSVQTFASHLVREEYENGLPHVIVSALRDGLPHDSHEIAFPDKAYYASTASAAGFDSPLLRLAYSSPRTPSQFIDYHMDTRERVLRREEKIPGHRPRDYVVERVFIASHDGVQVPLTILRHVTTPLDGSAPLLLYGYGSYGAILETPFNHYNPSRYALLDRGFVVADAHVRGGADMGRQWYLDGKLAHKKNSFLDFIAAARWLADNNYTSRGKIAAEGRSAGGLLTGAVANMAEDGLFGAMIADVPFVDVMNTILDDKLPLTPPEWEEWGNPITDAAAFDYMLSYSPYDNVTAKAYPALFISGGLTDPRVTYWEPAKWIAKLRDLNTGKQPLYMHIAMDSGHGGDPGRFSHLPEVARELAFLLSILKPRPNAG
jgi:oligopeptidase B